MPVPKYILSETIHSYAREQWIARIDQPFREP